MTLSAALRPRRIVLPSRRHPAGISPQQAYLDLQKLARAQGRNTQQLFEFYIHERFLARLAESRFSKMFVLKGGMLLAVLDVRRPTRDAGSDSPTQGDNAI